MAVQTSYSTKHAALYPGMLSEPFNPHNLVTRVNAEGAVVPFGKGVVTVAEGTAGLPVPASTAAQFNGVVMYELNHVQAPGAVAGVPDKESMTVVTHGVVAVKVLDTVAKDAAVYLRVGATDPGDFSGVVGTGDTLGVLIAGAKFLTAGDAGDTVLIALGVGG